MTWWEKLQPFHLTLFRWTFAWTGTNNGNQMPVTAKAFYDKFRKQFEKTAKDLGIPWELIATQAAVESGNGNSQLTVKDNNFFGITAGSWEALKKPVVNYPTNEQRKDGTWARENRLFRHYASIEECLVDYAGILTRLYPKALEQGRAGNALGFFQELRNGGWATDQQYAVTLAKRYNEIKPREGTA